MQNRKMFNNKFKKCTNVEERKLCKIELFFQNSLGKLTAAVCRQLFIVIAFVCH
jgi:hypothetical protein